MKAALTVAVSVVVLFGTNRLHAQPQSGSAGSDPNAIDFTVSVANQYINTNRVPVHLDIKNGTPYYIAVVDDPNFIPTGHTWQPYTTSNLVVDLGWAEGPHNLWIGVKGPDANAVGKWQFMPLTMITQPPLIVVTNPTGNTVSDPLVTIQGMADEYINSLTFDVSNATRLLTNQTGYLSDEFYDADYSPTIYSSFQLYDVPLTNGLNTITIHATDSAGNITVTNVSFTLDYSTAINPPVLNIVWPQNDTAISGSNFTLHAQVDDNLDRVTATIVDSSGHTNVATAPAQRNGNVWAGLPLASGTNYLTVMAQNPAGNSVTTNLTLVQSGVIVKMDPLSSDQYNQRFVNVTGTISVTKDSLTVNGVQAIVHADGTWSATDVPVSPVGMAVFDLEVSSSDR